MTEAGILDELVRASARLTTESDFGSLVSVLVEQSADRSRSDLACLYVYADPENPGGNLTLVYRRGVREVASEISAKDETIAFIEECGEAVVLLENRESPFRSLFLADAMGSGIALPINAGRRRIGVLFLNSREERHYGNEQLMYLESLTRLAGGMLENSRLFQELKEHVKKIEALERYQESIFESMTNLLVTTDEKGKIRYFNRAARESLHLNEKDLGHEFTTRVGTGLGKKVLGTVEKSIEESKEVPGIQGIYKRTDGTDMDYSLNLAPLTGRRGKHEGMTMLFTDQTRERLLQDEMDVAVEERRVIKDMFSRYLSKDLVKNLTENPGMVKPGGDKKTATVFFADITGYTAFSEGKDPEYIIEVLNEFFSEAVEIVIGNRGYIDKFIGDCIMAAWGVPMSTEEEDAVLAVTSALEINDLVRSKNRSFFQGPAKNLKIAVGMHSGPLVAGNVGSSRRMDYTVLGDTVNTAARLESVAEGEEIIITENTASLLGDRFVLEKRKPVKVKGKTKPLVIFNVKGKA